MVVEAFPNAFTGAHCLMTMAPSGCRRDTHSVRRKAYFCHAKSTNV